MKKKENKRVTWMTTIVGAVLAALSLSLIFYENSGDTAEETQHTSAAEGPYYEPGARPPTSVQTGGTTDNGVTYGGIAWGSLKVGYVGKNKIIQDSDEVLIPRLGSDVFGLVETNVTVKRLDMSGNVMQTLTGKALVFANARDSADAGYVMVHQSEARNWVAVLNGNPDYVFNSSKSNIYPYTIKAVDSGVEITAYNLADLAYKSGGKGDPPPGDGLTRIRDDLYLKRDGFIATPRPVGSISTDKTHYNVGETVNITWGAQDFSAYDKGHIIEELSVVHKDTGEKWDFIVDNQVVRSSAGGSSAPRSFAAAGGTAAAANEVQPMMQSASSQSSPAPEQTPVGPVGMVLPKTPDGTINHMAIVTEFVDGNLTQNAPFTESQIPSEVAQLPKGKVFRLVIQDSPDYLPKTPGTNWTAGTMLRTGWDTSYVLLDSTDPAEGQVPVAMVAWESLEILSAYENPNGTNVIMAKLKDE